MFKIKEKKDPYSKGYHLTEPLLVKNELENFIDVCNERNLEIIQVLSSGVTAQVIYKVH